MGNHFKVIRIRDIVQFLIAVAIPLLVGGFAGFLTQNSRTFYATLQKPPLAPPGFVFPIVWTVLYALIGIASYLVFKKSNGQDIYREALYGYAASLVLSFVWPLVFFRLQALFGAFWVLFLLWLITGITNAKFYRISHAAGLLFLPYWFWITYAGYLNLATWLLNR